MGFQPSQNITPMDAFEMFDEVGILYSTRLYRCCSDTGFIMLTGSIGLPG